MRGLPVMTTIFISCFSFSSANAINEPAPLGNYYDVVTV